MLDGRMLLKPARRAIDLFRSVVDWLYPPVCSICGECADLAPFLCSECFSKLHLFDGTPDSIKYHKDQPAKEVKALYYFDEILQQLIHDIKYRDASYVATFLGAKLGDYYKGKEIAKSKALIPVPLYSVRKRERTYNQSGCLARGISKEWGVDVEEKWIKRVRNTRTQTKLNKTERQANIQGAFKIRNKVNLPDTVCIVDDVFTTGATTMELARTLKNNGVREIFILCLATPYHGTGKRE
jgi:ComF family protein